MTLALSQRGSDKTSFSFLQVLVLGNKRDLPNALDEKQLIEKMWGMLILFSYCGSKALDNMPHVVFWS